jgi:hypothetical protein
VVLDKVRGEPAPPVLRRSASRHASASLDLPGPRAGADDGERCPREADSDLV